MSVKCVCSQLLSFECTLQSSILFQQVLCDERGPSHLGGTSKARVGTPREKKLQMQSSNKDNGLSWPLLPHEYSA